MGCQWDIVTPPSLTDPTFALKDHKDKHQSVGEGPRSQQGNLEADTLADILKSIQDLSQNLDS